MSATTQASLLQLLPFFHSHSLTAIAPGLVATLFLHRFPQRGDFSVVLVALTFVAGTVYGRYLLHLSFLTSALSSLHFFVYHALTVVIATVLYRISPLHPLYKYPGPFINKVTSLKLAHMVYTGKRHIVIRALHERYGVHVRTGPNTLSINSYSAIAPIYASSTAYPKSNAYTPGRMHGDGLFFIQGIEEHNARRRIWAPAFQPRVLAGWKDLIEKRVWDLLACIQRRGEGVRNGTINLSDAIQHWSYDVMGDITYGGAASLDLMNKGDPNGYVAGGQLSTVCFEVLGEVPSLFDLIWYLPVTRIARVMEKFAQDLIDARQNGLVGREDDIASFLLGEHEDTKSEPLSRDALRVESLFGIQAGSDTTSGVLTFAFYHLFTNPEQYARLRDELDEAFPDYRDTDEMALSLDTLNALPYLSATVDECLRLGTPFPGLPRVVPPGGAVLADKFVPGGTIVAVNPWAQMTSPDNFSPEPFAFRPERWLPGGLGPDTVARRGAIMSFSYGSFSCLGRALAIQEMRYVLSHLLLKYDWKVSPDWERQKFEAGIMNMRTSIFEYPLLAVATPRTAPSNLFNVCGPLSPDVVY
ncbi:cytochrome P450 [Mycena galericulata]|nr:cytochrome P450 [Mycena galericulata]